MLAASGAALAYLATISSRNKRPLGVLPHGRHHCSNLLVQQQRSRVCSLHCEASGSTKRSRCQMHRGVTFGKTAKIIYAQCVTSQDCYKPAVACGSVSSDPMSRAMARALSDPPSLLLQ